MNTKRVFKKLTAFAVGASMLGATMMGALAADLSDYPDAFVSDGTFDGFFVVGEAAASVDNLAMTDIATSMWVVGDGESTTTTIEGDSWLVESSGNFLELGEKIQEIETYIDSSQMDSLADGEISNSKGVSGYEQYLYFDEADATTSFQEDDNDNVDFFYKVTNGDVIARYSLEFTEALESDIDSSGVLDDIEDEVVSILGKEYTVVTATNSSTLDLVLMGGASSDTLEEGETATYEVTGTEYEVTLESVTSTEVQFTVNGETTAKLQDGETDVLEDGTNIGVTDITYQDYAGGIHTASFFLGADKLELQNGQSLKVNEETISEAAVSITWSEANSDVSIDDIGVNMTADDDLYVPVGGKLSENSELNDPEVLFTQNWDIELADVTSDEEDTVSLSFSEGDDQADLRVALYDGEVLLPWVFDNSSSADQVVLGDDDDKTLVLNASASITDEDYFFLSTSDPTSQANDAKSYLFQYKGADDSGETNPKVRIKNVATGDTLERSLTTSTGTFDLKIGGTTFNFANTSAISSDDFNIQLSSGGSDGVATYNTDGLALTFRTAANNEVVLTSVNESLATANHYLTVTVDDTDKFDDTSPSEYVVLNVSVTGGSSAQDLSSSTLGASWSEVQDPVDDDVSYGVSNYGETVTITDQTSGPTTYDLSIPSEQAQVMLYVTSGATESTSVTTGDLTQVQVVDATKLDSEVADVEAQNLIVVGGPCVNTVAAELLDNPSDCTEGFTAGVARVKMMDNGDNVAMLVAGYSGDDTRLAGKVIANRYDELSGEEVEIEGTTYSDATIAAPSEEVVVEEETVAEDTTETTETTE